MREREGERKGGEEGREKHRERERETQKKRVGVTGGINIESGEADSKF